MRRLLRGFLALALLFCAIQAHAITEIKGSPVTSTLLMSGVTTNTSAGPVRLPSGEKTFHARVVGTGSVTQTVAIYGDVDMDLTGGILLCTITLSGTPRRKTPVPS